MNEQITILGSVRRNWILITSYYYFEFSCRNIPNIIQIISLPSALGILAYVRTPIGFMNYY